jgi:hypothetical protein
MAATIKVMKKLVDIVASSGEQPSEEPQAWADIRRLSTS